MATAASARMAPTRPHPRTSRTWLPVTPWRASSQVRQAVELMFVELMFVELVTLVMADPPMASSRPEIECYAYQKHAQKTSRLSETAKLIIFQFQLKCILIGPR